MDHRTVSVAQRERLRSLLRGHHTAEGTEGLPLYMGADTSVLDREPVDTQVIDAVQSVPVHY